MCPPSDRFTACKDYCTRRISACDQSRKDIGAGTGAGTGTDDHCTASAAAAEAQIGSGQLGSVAARKLLWGDQQAIDELELLQFGDDEGSEEEEEGGLLPFDLVLMVIDNKYY
jgi:hypothetical protein